jgi:hypothetical protein
MRRHRLLALALSALLFSALSPALAQAKPPAHAHGKGPAKPEAHDNGRADKPAAKPAKPPKASRHHLSGGGVTANGAEFSVNAKTDKLKKGHFHYESADGLLKIKCRGFDTFEVVNVQPSPPAVRVTAHCDAKQESLNARPVRTQVLLAATFVDKGEPGTADEANISVTNPAPDGRSVVSDSGILKSGDIKIK